jgi:hypothetical protein
MKEDRKPKSDSGLKSSTGISDLNSFIPDAPAGPGFSLSQSISLTPSELVASLAIVKTSRK